MKIPGHIAIIMDGNGRWARKRGLPRLMGHKRGVDRVKEIVTASTNLGVKYLTIYAFSTENWQRPKKEVEGLFKLLEVFLNKELELFKKNNVRFRVIGDREELAPFILKKVEWFEKETENHNKLVLNVALNYGSREEILKAVKNISRDVKTSKIKLDDINEKLFSKYLYTKDSPDPDLLIRTSGEMRISNFLLWQISYSEIYIVDKFWPDFRERDLVKAIEEYNRRERRFGK